jgi:hypothetical protein
MRNKIIVFILILIVTGSYIFYKSQQSSKHNQFTIPINIKPSVKVQDFRLEAPEAKENVHPEFEEAVMLAPTKELYNISTFGIYSPTLENKTIEKIESKYKGALITSRYAEVNEIYINTWTIDKLEDVEKIDLPYLPKWLLPKNVTSNTYYDFPILDGYEFWASVVKEKYISARIPENPKPDKYYINNKGIKMIKHYLECSKSACGVKLEFLTFIHNDQKQLFVNIYKSVNYLNVDERELNNQLNEAFNEIEKFADTLSLDK